MKKILLTFFLSITLITSLVFANRPQQDVSNAYAAIKSNYAIAVNHSKGKLTWKDWDKLKGPLHKNLANQNLNTNQIWVKTKADFGRVTQNKAWSSWDIITGKSKAHRNLHDLHTTLNKLTHAKKRNTAIDTKYASIKAGFRVAVNNSNGALTWKDWDKIKRLVHMLISNTNLSQQQISAQLTTLLGTTFNLSGNQLTNISNFVQGKVRSSTSSTVLRLPNYLYSRAEIKTAVASPSKGKGKVIPYFGYWHPKDIKARTNNNGFWYLSNYFVSDPKIKMDVTVRLSYKGTTYSFNNVEAAYQAGKCLISGFISTPAQINEFVNATPDQSKYLANTKYKYKFKLFDAGRIDAMMRSLVRQKFINGPLGKKLVKETGETTLIEGNAWDDAIWGAPFDGIRHIPAKAGIMKGKQGQNKLGKILVQIRNDLKKGAAKEFAFRI